MPSPQLTSSTVRFSRVMRLRTLTAVGLSISVGLGVFGVLGNSFQTIGNAGALTGPYLLLVIVATPIVLTLAERGAVVSGTGGVYSLVRHSGWLWQSYFTGWLLLGGHLVLSSLLGISAALHLNVLFQQLFALSLDLSLLATIIIGVMTLNMLIGYSAGVDGIEIGSFLNMQKYYVQGVQIGGFANIVGTYMEGFQSAGFMNIVKEEVSGVQASGFMNFAGEMNDAVQLAGFANLTKLSNGGFQVSGFMNTAPVGFQNGQVSGFANISAKTEGPQMITKSMIGSPIYLDNEIIGVIFADVNKLDWFDEIDRETLEAISSQASIAIKNYDLYNKAFQR